MRIDPVAAPTLAIRGGTPVRSTLLGYGRQTVTDDDVQAVVDVLRSDWLTTGPVVQQFEQALATRVGARHAVVFSSGTAALHGAVSAAGLGPGDEAITSPLTFCATANAVVYQNATPVFADIDAGTLTISPEKVDAALTPRTKAILPVDFGGHPAALDAITAIARRRGLVVIEDACHALGARLGRHPIGSISTMTVFSFHPVKHITTGEGGAVTTDDDALADRLRAFRSHGIDYTRGRDAEGPWFYEMQDLGFNYRLSDIGCALGLSQLGRLGANLERRRRVATMYGDALSGVSAVTLPITCENADPAWHLYPIQLNLDALRGTRRDVFEALRAENIGVQVHYIPVHRHPYYARRFGYRTGDFPRAVAAYERLISLPMFSGMTDTDVADVVAAVQKVILWFSR